MAGAHNFPAASVRAVGWADVPGRGAVAVPAAAGAASFGAIHGTELGGAGVRTMMTTEFSGCSFCIKSVGGRTYAAHIMPSPIVFGVPPPVDGPRLAQQLEGLAPTVAAGNFANAAGGPGPFRIYGRGHSNHPHHPNGYPGQMTLLGFDAGGGTWRVYSQHRVGDVLGEVVQVWP